MRALLVVLALALAGTALPTTSAAAPFLTDPEGDVHAQASSETGAPIPGVPMPTGSGRTDSDLISLDIVESDDALDVTIGVAQIDPRSYFGRLYTNFAWGSVDHRVAVTYFGGLLQAAPGSFADLQVRRGNSWEFMASLDAPNVDVEAGHITVHLPKVYLLNEMQRTPGRGDALLVKSVVADANVVNTGVVNARFTDMMPDEEVSVPFTLALGDFSTGSLALSSPQNMRVSNGGATTFVFQVDLRNLGSAPATYALAISDLPAGWNATLRSPLKVPAKEALSVSVLVSVPFAHDHGGFSSFNLTATDEADPGSNGKLRLGVLHTPIPQPAGHHSELYLHASDPRSGPMGSVFSTTFPFARGWMNTMSDHTDDVAFITPFHDDGQLVWWIGLDPALQVGLDFDLEQLGELTATIAGKRDATADVTADLWYFRDSGGDGDSILLATGEPASVVFTRDAPSEVKLTLTPTLDADYIAYEPDTSMYLVISMSDANIGDAFFNTPFRPELETGSFLLKLPLNEYHDKLTGATEAAQSIEIVAKGLVEKIGRPGSVLTYTFDVINRGPPAVLTFDIAGNDISHATLVPSGDISLATGANRTVTLAVEIPYQANPGQEYEVLLFVHGKEDPSKMAIARTKTRAVTTGEDAMADESAQLLAAQARENQVPGAGGALVLVAAAVCALGIAARRR